MYVLHLKVKHPVKVHLKFVGGREIEAPRTVKKQGRKKTATVDATACAFALHKSDNTCHVLRSTS